MQKTDGVTSENRPKVNKPINRGTSGLPNPNSPVVNPKRPVPTQEKPKVVNPIPPQQGTPTVKKKKSKFIIILIFGCIFAIVVGCVIGKFAFGKEEPTPEPIVTLAYEDTGEYAIDNYLNCIKDYDASLITTNYENSWLAQEWRYANSNKLIESWIKSLCAYVSVTYPQVVVTNASGEAVLDSSGTAIMTNASLLNGEEVTFTVVDYKTLAETMKEDEELILKLYKESKYSPKDYNYTDEMRDLMLNYLLEKASYPTKTVNLAVAIGQGTGTIPEGYKKASESVEEVTESEIEPILNQGTLEVVPLAVTSEASDTNTSSDINTSSDVKTSEGTIYIDLHDEVATAEDGTSETVQRYTITDDSAIDELIFSSEDYHYMLDTFGTLINNYEYQKEDAVIQEKKAEHDKKYEAYLKKVEELKKENKEAKEDAEYYGTEYKEKKISKDDIVKEWEEPTRVSPKEYKAESVITYTWSGAYYSQNLYTGESPKKAQVGDGTQELPAGVGTPIITKALGADGKYHDVKVNLLTYKLGQDAIDYAVQYSEKNRGFDATSQVKLICYEVEVENLEDKEITINTDMYLSDNQSNQSARTGEMYGFYETATIKPHEKCVVNDWATSTEMDQKYVCWGKSFDRKYPVVWFKLLAGSGDEVPTYNATESFVNRSDEGSEESAESGTQESALVDSTISQ